MARNWLARQTVNLEAVSSILTEGEAIRTRTQSGLLYFWRASLYSCPSDGFAAGLDFGPLDCHGSPEKGK